MEQLSEKKVQRREVSKFYEIEIQKVFDALVTTLNFRMQLGTFFGTLNLAILTISFSSQKAGLIIVAGISLWIFILIDYYLRRVLFVYYYRGLQLQREFAQPNEETFLSLFGYAYIGDFLEKAQKEFFTISTMNSKKKFKAFLNLPWHVPNVIGFRLPLIISIVEIGFGLFFRIYFNWFLF